MSVIGAIPAFQEEGNIGPAVRSLFAVGCSRVVVLDGAWTGADGIRFLDGGGWSTDGTADEAVAAGATYISAASAWAGDGPKRSSLVRVCADPGDHVLMLDADERAEGHLPDALPDGHACVMLENDGLNDLPGLRGTFPHGDYSDRPIPLLRLFAYDGMMACEKAGQWSDGAGPITVYDRDEPVLPVLDGVTIRHLCGRRAAERVAAKRRYLEAQKRARRIEATTGGVLA